MLFPAPFGPRKPKISPGCTATVRSSRARTPVERVRPGNPIDDTSPPYCLVRPTVSMAGVVTRLL